MTLTDANNNGVFDNYAAEVLQADDYYPFGMRITRKLSASDNKYTYNGKEHENEFGLNWYHYGARYYDPAIGRWCAVDPVDEFYSAYNYVGNNPTNKIDIDGEASGDGHHYFPQTFWNPSNKEPWGFSKEAIKVFDSPANGTTGPLLNPKDHIFDTPHRAYNDAVGSLAKKWCTDNNIDVGKMTATQANQLLDVIKNSDDPVIKNYNAKLIPKQNSVVASKIGSVAGKFLMAVKVVQEVINFADAYKVTQEHNVSIWQELTWRLVGTSATEQKPGA